MNLRSVLQSSAVLRGRHLWGQLRERMAQDVNHAAVLGNVTEGGGLTPRFAFMAVMSCGIAILGLLQSSAAVVIGAMLISPLMGPIVQLGFSLCVVDFRMMGRSGGRRHRRRVKTSFTCNKLHSFRSSREAWCGAQRGASPAGIQRVCEVM